MYNGTCTEPVLNDYYCQCLPGIVGYSCHFVVTATFDGTSLVSLKPLTANQERGKRSVDTTIREVTSHLDERKLSHDVHRLPRQADNVLDMKFTFKTTVKEGILLLALGVNVITDQHLRNFNLWQIYLT